MVPLSLFLVVTVTSFSVPVQLCIRYSGVRQGWFGPNQPIYFFEGQGSSITFTQGPECFKADTVGTELSNKKKIYYCLIFSLSSKVNVIFISLHQCEQTHKTYKTIIITRFLTRKGLCVILDLNLISGCSYVVQLITSQFILLLQLFLFYRILTIGIVNCALSGN